MVLAVGIGLAVITVSAAGVAAIGFIQQFGEKVQPEKNPFIGRRLPISTLAWIKKAPSTKENNILV